MKKFLSLLFLFSLTLTWGQQTDVFPNALQFKVTPVNNTATRVLVMDATGKVRERAVSTIGGSGGAATWGTITGTLTSQIDLVNYINTKIQDSLVKFGVNDTIFTNSRIVHLNGNSMNFDAPNAGFFIKGTSGFQDIDNGFSEYQDGATLASKYAGQSLFFRSDAKQIDGGNNVTVTWNVDGVSQTYSMYPDEYAPGTWLYVYDPAIEGDDVYVESYYGFVQELPQINFDLGEANFAGGSYKNVLIDENGNLTQSNQGTSGLGDILAVDPTATGPYDNSISITAQGITGNYKDSDNSHNSYFYSAFDQFYTIVSTPTSNKSITASASELALRLTNQSSSRESKLTMEQYNGGDGFLSSRMILKGNGELRLTTDEGDINISPGGVTNLNGQVKKTEFAAADEDVPNHGQVIADIEFYSPDLQKAADKTIGQSASIYTTNGFGLYLQSGAIDAVERSYISIGNGSSPENDLGSNSINSSTSTTGNVRNYSTANYGGTGYVKNGMESSVFDTNTSTLKSKSSIDSDAGVDYATIGLSAQSAGNTADAAIVITTLEGAAAITATDNLNQLGITGADDYSDNQLDNDLAFAQVLTVKKLITAAGGGGTPTAQQVFDEDPSVFLVGNTNKEIGLVSNNDLAGTNAFVNINGNGNVAIGGTNNVSITTDSLAPLVNTKPIVLTVNGVEPNTAGDVTVSGGDLNTVLAAGNTGTGKDILLSGVLNDIEIRTGTGYGVKVHESASAGDGTNTYSQLYKNKLAFYGTNFAGTYNLEIKPPVFPGEDASLQTLYWPSYPETQDVDIIATKKTVRTVGIQTMGTTATSFTATALYDMINAGGAYGGGSIETIIVYGGGTNASYEIYAPNVVMGGNGVGHVVTFYNGTTNTLTITSATTNLYGSTGPLDTIVIPSYGTKSFVDTGNFWLAR